MDSPKSAPEKPRSFEYKYCPCCATELKFSPKVNRMHCDDDKGGCGWVHWNSPQPVASALIPFPERFIGRLDVKGPFDFDIEEYRDTVRTGVVLIRRGIQPFIGRWAMPGGFVNEKETPRAAGVREAKEETGLDVEMERVIHPCNPLPGILNQVVIPWVARPIDGQMIAGDDAMDVGIFGPNNLPDICFTSHIKTVRDWFDGKYGSISGKKGY